MSTMTLTEALTVGYDAGFPAHPALLVLAWEDERTDVHGAGCRSSGRNEDGCYVKYTCHCGYQTDECATDFDATAHLISHAIKTPTEARFTVIATRTDSTWRAIDGENLTAQSALSLIACNRKLAEGKHLRNADGELVPYLSVARWAMVPQLAA